MSDDEDLGEHSAAGMRQWENALITAIIDRKSIREVIKQKITTDFIFDPTANAGFKFLLNWYKNPAYADTPSWHAFLHSFPAFEREDIDDSITAICDKLREHKVYADIGTMIDDVIETTGVDTMEGFKLIRQRTSELITAHTVDSSADVRSQIDDIRAQYLQMKEMEVKLRGLPYPWPLLTHVTMGAQNGQFIIFYARPKTGKSWLLLACLHHWHHFSGAVPVLFSQEMTVQEVAERYVSIATGVDYDRMLRGQLEGQEERDFFDNLDAFMEEPPVIIDRLTETGADAAMEYKAKCQEYGCSVGAVDGLYFLGGDVKEIVAATRGLKAVTNEMNIVTLGATQRLRIKQKNGAQGQGQQDGSDLYGSDSYLQDCDLLLLAETDVEMRRNKEISIYTAAMRKGGKSARFLVNIRPGGDFSQKRVLPSADESDDAAENMDNVDAPPAEERE